MAKTLIVDDAQIMRKTIKSMLNIFGHTVIGEALNGYEAIEEYKRLKPDLVTMDINMPNVNNIPNGIEAIKKIIEFDPQAKIIVISSLGQEQLVIQAIQYGATNYILKPLTKEKLELVVNKSFIK